MLNQRLLTFFLGICAAAAGAACSAPAPQNANVASGNANVAAGNANVAAPAAAPNAAAPAAAADLPTVASHGGEKAPPAATPTAVPKSDVKTKWTQSGNPIDTSALDADVARAEKEQKGKPNDAEAKKALAAAFIARGLALTEARQYAAALGDYRRALKFDPNSAEARQWIAQIVGIYESINREYPPEGQEPPPLPFKKG